MLIKRIKIFDIIKFENIVKGLKNYKRNLKNDFKNSIYAIKYRFKKCFKSCFKKNFKEDFEENLSKDFKKSFNEKNEYNYCEVYDHIKNNCFKKNFICYNYEKQGHLKFIYKKIIISAITN